MSGKDKGFSGATGLGFQWRPRLTRAYAEGRKVGKAGGVATDNPADGKGKDIEKAWDYGFDNQADADFKFECAQ